MERALISTWKSPHLLSSPEQTCDCLGNIPFFSMQKQINTWFLRPTKILAKKYSQLFSVPIESRYVDPQAPIKLLRCRLPRELKRELLIKRYWRVSTKKQHSVSMKLYFNVQPFTNRKWAISTVKIRFKSYYWITILSCLKTKRKRKIKLSEKQKRKSSWVGKISLRPIRLKRTHKDSMSL